MSANRYSRQILMPEIGEDGQRVIHGASALIVGVGGLGCPAALYLAAAGIGRLGLMDGDLVDSGNLQRQILFGEADIASRKTDAGARRLRELRSDLELTIESRRLHAEDAVAIFRDYDVIVDGTDSFTSKFLINDAALAARRPVVAAGVSGFEGWVGVFGVGEGPCYRCWIPKEPRSRILSCQESGVLAPAAGVIGSLQAVEVVKVILARHGQRREWSPLCGRLLAIDFSVLDVRDLRLSPRADCVCRGDRSRIRPVDSAVRGLDPIGTADCVPGGRDWPLVEEGFVVLDVREDEERVGDPPTASAVHWPLSRILSGEKSDEEELAFPEQSDRWLVVCRRGVRSAHAVRLLRQWFPEKEFVNLAGGLEGRRAP